MSFAQRLFGGLVLLVVLVVLRGPLNAVLRPLFDVVLGPFRGMHPMVGLTVISIPLSIGALVLFRVTSDQKQLVRIKDRIFAGLFEIRLFNDDLGAIFRAQGEILAQNLRYLGHALVPLLWLIGPFIFVIGHLQFHYGFQGLQAGEQTLLQVELDEDWLGTGPGGSADRPDVKLEVPDGITVETPMLWLSSRNEAVWRLVVEAPGSHDLQIRVGEDTVTKEIRVSDDIVRRSPLRVAAGLLDFDDLLYPAEAPLPKDGPIESIALGYREGGSFGGLSGWVWAFFGLTIVIGFALKDRFGVEL